MQFVLGDALRGLVARMLGRMSGSEAGGELSDRELEVLRPLVDGRATSGLLLQLASNVGRDSVELLQLADYDGTLLAATVAALDGSQQVVCLQHVLQRGVTQLPVLDRGEPPGPGVLHLPHAREGSRAVPGGPLDEVGKDGVIVGRF